MAKRITILGSTGSIGRSALAVLRQFPGQFVVQGLSTNANIDLLAKQVVEFAPNQVAIVDAGAAARFSRYNLNVDVRVGPAALEHLAHAPADIALCAIVGAAGLPPLLAAIETGKRIALANKEPLVMAGAVVMAQARRHAADILPVDSEHSALFQCLEGRRIDEVATVYLTASGGPFYRQPRHALEQVTPEQAANHPTWDMGAKISVDSATLMNKGLEIIEAMWLFGLPLDKIAVVIHPQSVVHGLVEFVDGNVLAHLGATDMRFPIQFALTWPERVPAAMDRLRVGELGTLAFEQPDFAAFPCLRLALEAARVGGTAPAVLNAANEVAVESFCRHQISFLQISDIIEEVMTLCAPTAHTDLGHVLEADREARRRAADAVQACGV
jgi:1-deoxy-D-xylulose-5-phosphate reductoisomerase